MSSSINQQSLYFDIIDVENGLASNQVHDLIQDELGYIWLIGSEGLSRYNGTHVTIYGKNEGLITQGLRSIARDNYNQLWIGSDSGLNRITQTNLTSHSDGSKQRFKSIHIDSPIPEDDWIYNHVECIIADKQNTIWLGTPHGLIYYQPSQKWGLSQEPIVKNQQITALLIDPLNRIWVAGPTFGLVYFKNYKWYTLPNPDWKQIGLIKSLINGPNQTIIVGGENGAIQIDDSGASYKKLEQATHNQQIQSTLIYNKQLWIATDSQLLIFEESNNLWLKKETLLSETLINSLLADKNGNVWAATENKGAFKFSKLLLSGAIVKKSYFTRNNLSSIRATDPYHSLLGGGKNSALLHTHPDIAIHPIAPLSDKYVWDIIPYKHSDYLAATSNGFFHIDQNSGIKKIGADHPLLNQAGRTIAIDESSQRVWLGSRFGLCLWDETTNLIEEITPHNGSFGYVYTLIFDQQKRLWIGTLGNGLWRRDEKNQFKQISNHLLNQKDNIYGIAFNQENQCLVCQDNRVFLIDQDDNIHLLLTHSKQIAAWAIQWDFWKPNQFWMGTSSGLELWVIQNNKAVILRELFSFWGHSGWSFTTSRSLSFNNEGLLFCGLSSGLIVISPETLYSDFKSRPELFLDYELLSFTDDEKKTVQFGTDPALSLTLSKQGKWTLNIHFYTPWYTDTVLYRYQLIGFDVEWSDYSLSSSKNYTSLPPGQYTFQAQAYAPTVGEGPIKQLLHINVPVSGWINNLAKIKEWINFSTFKSYLQNRSLNADNQRLNHLLELKTRELTEQSETLALQSTIDALTDIHNRRALTEQLTQVATTSRVNKTPLSFAILDIDFFKKYNDNNGHFAGDDCLQQIALSFRLLCVSHKQFFVARYGGEEFALILGSISADEAKLYAEKLRLAVKNLKIPYDSNNPDDDFVTVSIGIVTVADSKKIYPENLIQQADAALYESKEAGRNRWTHRIIE